MASDEEWHVFPCGLGVKGSNGPRIVNGVDTLTGERAGGQPPTPKEVEEAEARSVERRRQRAQSIFTDPVWPADRVVSWIGYRDAQAIEESFAPIHYKNSRPLVEGAPRIALLRALQEGRIHATQRRGLTVHIMIPNEWFPVERAWQVHLWPECTFARVEVIGMWPPVDPLIEHQSSSPEVIGLPTLKDQQVHQADNASATEKRQTKSISDLDTLNKVITSAPMKPGMNRNEWHAEIERRLQEQGLGKKANRGATRKLHGDVKIYPDRPGYGPHKSAESLGKK